MVEIAHVAIALAKAVSRIASWQLAVFSFAGFCGTRRSVGRPFLAGRGVVGARSGRSRRPLMSISCRRSSPWLKPRRVLRTLVGSRISPSTRIPSYLTRPARFAGHCRLAGCSLGLSPPLSPRPVGDWTLACKHTSTLSPVLPTQAQKPNSLGYGDL
jgi:hypothetical protein